VRADRSSPVVAIVTHVGVGYLDEPDSLTGISHVLEHMFFKGTRARGPGELGRETKAAGGILNASTGYDRTIYHTVLPSSSLEEGMALQSDALLHSRIDGEELRRELDVIIQEAKRKLDSPHAVALETLYETMFDVHRLRRWRIGTEAGLSQLTREDVSGWYRRTYRPERVVLSIAGDVDTEHVLDLAHRLYGPMAAIGEAPAVGPEEPERRGFRFREMAGDVQRAYIEWGWRTPGPLHADTAALHVLAVTLGQGRASRLYRGVRDRGLASEVGAGNRTPRDTGVFGASAVTEPGEAVAALEAMARLTDGSRPLHVRAPELERAKRISEAGILRTLETAQGQAMLVGEWQALGDWRLAEVHLERVLATDVEDIERVASVWLTPDRATVFVYRPAPLPTGRSGESLRHTLFDGPMPDLPPPIAIRSARLSGKAATVRCASAEDAVHVCTLGETARIVILPRHASPLVTLAIAFAGGANEESIEESGWTGLMARVSLRGTRTRDAAGIAEAAESLGGSITPSVESDAFDWSVTVPSRHLHAAFDLLADVTFGPTFPDAEVETERKSTLARLVQLRDDMFAFPLRLVMEAAFAGHPYGARVEDTEAAIARVTAASLRDRHRSFVERGAPWLFAVGDIEVEAVLELASAVLHGAQSASSAAQMATWPASPAHRSVQRETAQSAIAIAFPGPPRNDPDALALRVFANAVGGLGGALFEDLRSRRSLAYTVSAYPVARRFGGAFAGYIATSPDRAEEARSALLEGLVRLAATPLSRTDLERAQRYTVGVRRIQTQTNGARLGQLASALLLGRGLEEIRDFEARVTALTPSVVRDAAVRWLDPARVATGMVHGTGGSR
jgi:zinc protease